MLMISGTANQKITLATASTAMVMVVTAEMARQASGPFRVDRRSTKTGTKVADRTPPSTMSWIMLGVLLARLYPSANHWVPMA